MHQPAFDFEFWILQSPNGKELALSSDHNHSHSHILIKFYQPWRNFQLHSILSPLQLRLLYVSYLTQLVCKSKANKIRVWPKDSLTNFKLTFQILEWDTKWKLHSKVSEFSQFVLFPFSCFVSSLQIFSRVISFRILEHSTFSSQKYKIVINSYFFLPSFPHPSVSL